MQPQQIHRRRRLIAAIPVPIVLIGAGVAAYLAGAFNNDGDFRAEPPACATLEPSLHLLGVAYTTKHDESNNCGLLLPNDHPRYVPSDTITVAYYVATPRRQDAPDAASELLATRKADARPPPTWPLAYALCDRPGGSWERGGSGRGSNGTDRDGRRGSSKFLL